MSAIPRLFKKKSINCSPIIFLLVLSINLLLIVSSTMPALADENKIYKAKLNLQTADPVNWRVCETTIELQWTKKDGRAQYVDSKLSYWPPAGGGLTDGGTTWYSVGTPELKVSSTEEGNLVLEGIVSYYNTDFLVKHQKVRSAFFDDIDLQGKPGTDTIADLLFNKEDRTDVKHIAKIIVPPAGEPQFIPDWVPEGKATKTIAVLLDSPVSDLLLDLFLGWKAKLTNLFTFGPNGNLLHLEYYTDYRSEDISSLPSSPKTHISTLSSDQTLYPGDILKSKNGYTKLVYQTDGNLVLYNNFTGKALWASWTQDKARGGKVIMQNDGNLVVKNADNEPVWNSKTFNNPGSRLVLQNDNNLVIYNSGNKAIWATMTTPKSPMTGGDALGPGQFITSQNGYTKLVFQADDGNLVLYSTLSRKALWASGTNQDDKKAVGGRVIMQNDGNLVVYNASGKAVWDSKTFNNSGSRLVLQNDNNLVIYRGSDNKPIWATGTYTKTPMEKGDALGPGQSIKSRNGYTRLVYQTDGNLVLYNNFTNKALWNSKTSKTNGYSVGKAYMQYDGNFVVRDASNKIVWATWTDGNPGSRLELQNDNNLVIYRGSDNKLIWDSDTYTKTPMTENDALGPGQFITSRNGSVKLVYQTDGNLVLYKKGVDGKYSTAIWASKTGGKSLGKLVMQKDDSNLVLYDASGEAIWAASWMPSWKPSYDGRFEVQSDGNMVIYDKSNNALWNSNTVLHGSVKAEIKQIGIDYGEGTATFDVSETTYWERVEIGKKWIYRKDITIKNTALGTGLYNYKNNDENGGDEMTNLTYKATVRIFENIPLIWTESRDGKHLGGGNPKVATVNDWIVLRPYGTYSFSLYPKNDSGDPLIINADDSGTYKAGINDYVSTDTYWTIQARYYGKYYKASPVTPSAKIN